MNNGVAVSLSPSPRAGSLTFFKERHRSWGLEASVFLILGLILLPYVGSIHRLDVVSETIVLVVFLSGLMGITRSIGIPLGLPLAWIPLIAGFGSMFMDSFLILLIVSRARIEGSSGERLKFLVLCSTAALVGGIGTYFGEVYLLPLCLKYGMREWWSTLPLWPPIILFLVYLGKRAKSLDVKLSPSNSGEKLTIQDCLEFAGFIILLLATKNAILCLTALCFWSYVTGQGEECVEGVWEIDKAVLLLLGAALLFLHAPSGIVVDSIKTWIGHADGWFAFIPSIVNGVAMGALYPANGDFFKEALILSTAVQFLPFSSLVGVMVFKPREWGAYFKSAFPHMVIWFVLCSFWIFAIWKPFLESHFYAVFKKRPSLEMKSGH